MGSTTFRRADTDVGNALSQKIDFYISEFISYAPNYKTMKTQFSTIMTKATTQLFDLLATTLASDHADLFKKKQSAKALKELFASIVAAETSDEGSEEVVDADDESPKKKKATPKKDKVWDAKAIKKLHESIAKLEDGAYYNLQSNRAVTSEKTLKKLICDDDHRVCVPKGEEDLLAEVVGLMGDGDEEKDDDADDDNYVDGYDAKKLAKLRKAIEKADDDECIDIGTCKVVDADDDKYVMHPDRHIALVKIDNKKDMKAYETKVFAMLDADEE